MRRWALLLVLGLPLAAVGDASAQPRQGDPGAQPRPGDAAAPQRQGPPHEWSFGVWTGGLFPASDTETPACFGSPTVIFTRDVVMRVSSLDTAYRQRTIETVAQQANGLEFRFTPATPAAGALGGRMPPDIGFGCDGNPNLLRVERRGPNEIAFPDCKEFPAPLKRCTTAR